MNSVQRSGNILIVVGSYTGYGRGLLRGIIRFTNQNPGWVYWVVHTGDPNTQLESDDIDGILAHTSDPVIIQKIKAIGKPVVNLSNTIQNIGVPLVAVDNAAIGWLGADYFLNAGFHHFAFAGDTRRDHSIQRWQAFRDRISQSGHTANIIDAWPNTELHHAARKWLVDWKKNHPGALAVMAVNDQAGRTMTDACRDVGLRIPDDIAILGVDNDDLDCDLSTPPLSSIQLPTERIGYEAMGLLHRMLRGGTPSRQLLLPPIQIITRQSTDLLAINDQEVRLLLQYIREHAGEPISLKEFFARTAVARCTVERRIRSLLGCSPMELITRAHMERAKDLLANSDLSMAQVARQSGFVNNIRFSTVFRREIGTTPRAYRSTFATRKAES